MLKGIPVKGPSRSDHRAIQYQLDTSFKGFRVQSCPKAFSKVSKVFEWAGGSWERYFLGSVRDVSLLRRVIKLAIKGKVLRREPKFY